MGERRRSSGGSLYKMNKAERARSLHEKGIDETLADTSLTHVTESSVKKKDFAKEVRAQRDIKSFIDNSEVLLDLPEVCTVRIISRGLYIFTDNLCTKAGNLDLKSAVYNQERVIMARLH